MTVPLAVLAVAAVGGGLLGLSPVTGILPEFLAPALGEAAEPVQGLSELALSIISVAVALAGIGVGWLVYDSGRIDWVALRARLAPIQRFLARGWYIDDAYEAILVAPGRAGSAFLAYVFDQRVIDGAVNGIGRLFLLAASAGRRVQTGLVRNYALAFLLGVVGILVYFGLRL
jgi:NADH-quinone oxidoreductase subunit L